jgi:hypothetical protein
MTMTEMFTTTYDTGGSSKPLPGVAVLPERRRTDADFEAMLGGQLNPVFIADFLSDALMHEQCGRHLYRAVAAQTHNPMLKRRYEHFGAETEEHITVLQTLVTAIGGDPGYVSPAARATEKLDSGAVEATFLVDGSLDLMTKELLMLNAVLLAETIDHANWEMIEQLGESLHEGSIQESFRDATAKVKPQEDDHVMWAAQTRKRLVALQATSPTMTGVATAMEEVVSRIASLFGDDDTP